MQKFLTAFGFLIISCVFSLAQTPTPTVTPLPKSTPDDDVVKISTTLIQIDVTVTDSKGKIVTNLKPEDFEIFENKEKQTITNFSFISAAPTAKPTTDPKANKNEISAPIPTVQLRPEQVRRTIALVIDDLGLSWESIHFVKRALKKFVNEQMQPDDFVAIIPTGNGSGVLQQFTSDKNMLLAAIDKMRWNSLGRGGISAFAPIEPNMAETAQETGDTTVTEEDIQAEKDRMAQFTQFREDSFTTGTLGAINFIAKGMTEMPGRKAIMFFSDGFSMCTDVDMREDSSRCTRMKDAVRQLTDVCNRAAVTIYTQDARGLQYTGLTAADRPASNPNSLQNAMTTRSAELVDKQEGLITLARDTGGRAVINNNDLNLGIEKMLEDTKGYYLIGYQPDSDTFDAKTRKFNTLEVKVKGKDLTVRYRSGFFGVADTDSKIAASSNQTPAQRISQAINSPFAAKGISLKLNTLFGKGDKQSTFVNSLLHIEAKDLKFKDMPDGKKKAGFDVLAVNYGDNGTIVDQIGKTYTITVNNQEGYEQLVKNGFTYQFNFPIKKPGSYQMRVAIRDTESSLVGSANQFIVVPDLKKNKLTLSGIILENMTPAQFGTLETNPGASPQQRGTDPMMDTSLRQFKRQTILRYAIEIYNAKLDQTQNANLQTQIRIFKDGKIYFDGKPNPHNTTGQNGLERFNFTAALSLGTQMPLGEYVLQIIVIDNLRKNKEKLASKWVQFEIVE